MADDTTSSGTAGFGSIGSLAPLALGAGGLGFLLSKGESKLPIQFGELEQNVPLLMSQGQSVFGQGGPLAATGAGLTAQGQKALADAEAGRLTPEQQAQLDQVRAKETNQARQMYYNMGRNPDQDTSFLSTTQEIDAHINAMSQQQIQTTIQLGLGELSSGASFTGQALGFETAGLGFESAANAALLDAGKAQLAQDKAYSDSLTSVFSAIGKMFGGIAGGAAGGPAGAAAGSAVGGGVGSAVDSTVSADDTLNWG